MAVKKVKHELVFEQDNGKNGGVSVVKTLLSDKKLMDTSDMTLSKKLATILLGGVILDALDKAYDSLCHELADTPLDEIISALVAEGSIKEGETPIISVVDRKGVKHSGELKASVSSKFDMEAFKALASDPDIFDSLPDEYKEIKLKGSTFFKKLFTEGALGSYEKYFSSTTETLTKIAKARVITKEDSGE